jgi:TolB-like protein/Tfp pilus assembly protein PilF
MIVIAVLALTLFTGRAEAIDSIAVLPLENFSGDPDQAYFTEGMHEELITELSKIGALKVIARPSVMRYRNSDKSLSEIAEELDVKGIVAGSTQQDGDRVRITVQLIEAETEQNLWAEKYDKDYRDILMLQGEVALDIAQEIKISLTSEEKERLSRERTVDPEAYDLVSRAAYLHNQYTEESMRKSLDYFEKAIEKDPSYALAYQEMAELVTDFVVFGYLSPHEGMRRGKELCLKAKELDESVDDGLLGWIKWVYEWDWKGAERELKRALEINPNSAKIHGSHFHYHAFMTLRYDEAMAHARRAMEIDPLNALYRYYQCDALWVSGQVERAIEEIQKLLEIAPDYPLAHAGLGLYYVEKQMFEEAILSFEEAVRLFGESAAFRGWLGYSYAAADKKEKALEILNGLIEESKIKYVSAGDIAHVYVGLHEIDRAFEWLDKAYEERSRDLVYIRKLPGLDLIRSDRRYQDLLRRMNLPEIE